MLTNSFEHIAQIHTNQYVRKQLKNDCLILVSVLGKISKYFAESHPLQARMQNFDTLLIDHCKKLLDLQNKQATTELD